MSSLAVWPAPVRDQNFYGKQLYDVNLHFSFLTLTHCTGPLCPCKVRRHVIVLMSHCLTRASLKIHLVQSKGLFTRYRNTKGISTNKLIVTRTRNWLLITPPLKKMSIQDNQIVTMSMWDLPSPRKEMTTPDIEAVTWTLMSLDNRHRWPFCDIPEYYLAFFRSTDDKCTTHLERVSEKLRQTKAFHTSKDFRLVNLGRGERGTGYPLGFNSPGWKIRGYCAPPRYSNIHRSQYSKVLQSYVKKNITKNLNIIFRVVCNNYLAHLSLDPVSKCVPPRKRQLTSSEMKWEKIWIV